jgi:hypothetical protein
MNRVLVYMVLLIVGLIQSVSAQVPAKPRLTCHNRWRLARSKSAMDDSPNVVLSERRCPGLGLAKSNDGEASSQAKTFA